MYRPIDMETKLFVRLSQVTFEDKKENRGNATVTFEILSKKEYNKKEHEGKIVELAIDTKQV